MYGALTSTSDSHVVLPSCGILNTSLNQVVTTMLHLAEVRRGVGNQTSGVDRRVPEEGERNQELSFSPTGGGLLDKLENEESMKSKPSEDEKFALRRKPTETSVAECVLGNNVIGNNSSSSSSASFLPGLNLPNKSDNLIHFSEDDIIDLSTSTQNSAKSSVVSAYSLDFSCIDANRASLANELRLNVGPGTRNRRASFEVGIPFPHELSYSTLDTNTLTHGSDSDKKFVVSRKLLPALRGSHLKQSLSDGAIVDSLSTTAAGAATVDNLTSTDDVTDELDCLDLETSSADFKGSAFSKFRYKMAASEQLQQVIKSNVNKSRVRFQHFKTRILLL